MADRIPEPVEAKKYLARKTIVETEKWDELKHGEHAHVFTVAHSRNAGVLDGIFEMMNTAKAEGKSFNSFKSEMKDLMIEKHWYGKKDEEGKGYNDNKEYATWRTKMIYHTNMRTAYSAARYRQQVRGAGMRPIWQYISKLVGGSRRDDHLALHDKAFRWDDPFWNENYPPNGWGCECLVAALSEAEAEREGVEVLETDSNGNPPNLIDKNGNAVDWNEFATPEWQYNVGREALAPNFANFKNLSPDALHTVMRNYNQSMNGTVLPKEEWLVIAQRANEMNYKPTNTILQIGNLNEKDYLKVQAATGIFDSKVMATDHDLWHSMGHKQLRIQNAKDRSEPQDAIQRLINQAVDVKDFDAVYKTYSSPENIFYQKIENKKKNETEIFLHFTKSMSNSRTLRIIFRTRETATKKNNSAMQLVTMEVVDNREYLDGRYTQINK
ncbi:MAG: phage minor head protein [Treponema sp.]|nr:phage minor head protein [Treponema sp.]